MANIFVAPSVYYVLEPYSCDPMSGHLWLETMVPWPPNCCCGGSLLGVPQKYGVPPNHHLGTQAIQRFLCGEGETSGRHRRCFNTAAAAAAISRGTRSLQHIVRYAPRAWPVVNLISEICGKTLSSMGKSASDSVSHDIFVCLTSPKRETHSFYWCV